ncbi:MAG: hypothetical protein ACI9W4_000886 [Rhodothermales bacterium]|jgi:uncharacterized protein (DUF1501 family)
MCTIGSTLSDGDDHDRAHEAWSRRQFIRGLALGVGGAAVGLNGVGARASSSQLLLQALANADPDRVLVLIQLSGGNDGLNTVVPFANDLYYQARPRLGISASQVVKLTAETGLHPSLAQWESLFKDGQLGIVQTVGYDQPELSHFLSTDVWMTAGSPGHLSGTGWLGRYLGTEYPDFSQTPPDRPVAMQIGSTSPLLFQSASGSLGVNFPSLSLLNRLTEGGGVFDETDVPDTLFGEQLAYVRRISNDSFTYAEAIKDSHEAGANLASYAGDSLSLNLATVARLIRGGLGARIYHVTLGGFDTHANQVGGHSTLLRWLGNATASFMQDLGQDGLDDRVMAMTFSEFGRRIRENSSAGTDHGTAAPLFVFGGGSVGGLIGSAPDLASLDPNGNLRASTDFRSVYASVLRQWFDASEDATRGLLGQTYADLSLFSTGTASAAPPSEFPGAFEINALYPNPVKSKATLELALPTTLSVRIELIDLLGRTVAEFADRRLTAGLHSIPVSLPGRLASGAYLLKVSSGDRVSTRSLVVTR